MPVSRSVGTHMVFAGSPNQSLKAVRCRSLDSPRRRKPITVPGTIDSSESGRTIADVLLPDGTNVNHELVKEGWCWWYRKYAPGDTMLEGLEAEARDGSGLTQVSPVWRITFLLLRDISPRWSKNRILLCL